MARALERETFEPAEYEHFGARLRHGLDAFRALLARPGFGEGPITLGAELELSLVDATGRALMRNLDVVRGQDDPRLVLELDRFNVEYNLPPVVAAGRPFTGMERGLARALATVDAAAAPHGGRAVAVGILPTLTAGELASDALTDLPRYRALAAGIGRLRTQPNRLRINGPEPLAITSHDITLEGACTSFQVHLRVEPSRYADTYNAAQLATPVALAMGANSPVFLEHLLWEETRVAVFKLSLDSRDLLRLGWQPAPRVYFGNGWVRRGAYELFAESVALFPPLFPIATDEDALSLVRDGVVPRLAELRLHQGTVWRWNRAIYDPGEGGHLRIELRALPGGPTPRDMAASAAFLVGLTMGLRDGIEPRIDELPFRYCDWNFYRAAQEGLDATLLWPSDEPPSPREMRVTDLVPRLLPVAARGLDLLGVDHDEIAAMLEVIRGRLEQRQTGARWQRGALARLDRASRPEALREMLAGYMAWAGTARPVHEWEQGA